MVQLYADGVAYGDPVKVSSDMGWKYTWKGLKAVTVNADGTTSTIKYTAKEFKVSEYATSSSSDTFTITNVYKENGSGSDNPENNNSSGKDGPDTGDSNDLGFWAGICGASGVLLAGLYFGMRRRENSDSESEN